ncbi:MAG: hypothetical protein IIC58_14170, partial [Proteobacteria bacterium]|nr:hypothetical protein [Pseudomonadota bacterium]
DGLQFRCNIARPAVYDHEGHLVDLTEFGRHGVDLFDKVDDPLNILRKCSYKKHGSGKRRDRHLVFWTLDWRLRIEWILMGITNFGAISANNRLRNSISIVNDLTVLHSMTGLFKVNRIRLFSR